MNNKIVIVDEDDNQIDLADKIEAHTSNPRLHRAITCLIYNSKGELLITRRAKEKLLWPLIWEATVSTHPFEGESIKDCTKRRLKEELGIITEVKSIGRFLYNDKFKDIGQEHELCYILIGEYNGENQTDPEEIAEYRFVLPQVLKEEIKNKPEDFAPWLKPALEIYSSTVE